MPRTVTLYSAPWWAYCRIAKRFLDEQCVPYTEITIDEDEEAARRVEQWNNGNRTIPTLDYRWDHLDEPHPGVLAPGARSLVPYACLTSRATCMRRTRHEHPKG